jgi:hydrogenase maturation protease
MAQMLGDYPQHLLLIGVQPVELDDFGGSLRPLVKAQIQPAITLALQYLDTFDIHLAPLAPETTIELTDPMLNIQRYEAERPSESLACRLGDERVIYAPNVKIIPPSSIDGAIPIDVDFRGQY